MADDDDDDGYMQVSYSSCTVRKDKRVLERGEGKERTGVYDGGRR